MGSVLCILELLLYCCVYGCFGLGFVFLFCVLSWVKGGIRFDFWGFFFVVIGAMWIC